MDIFHIKSIKLEMCIGYALCMPGQTLRTRDICLLATIKSARRHFSALFSKVVKSSWHYIERGAKLEFNFLENRYYTSILSLKQQRI